MSVGGSHWRGWERRLRGMKPGGGPPCGPPGMPKGGGGIPPTKSLAFELKPARSKNKGI